MKQMGVFVVFFTFLFISSQQHARRIRSQTFCQSATTLASFLSVKEWEILVCDIKRIC